MRSRSVVSLSLVVATLACSGGGDGGPTTPPVPTVASVSVALAASSLTPGQTTSATATARDAQGSTIAGKTPTWSSSNAAVATVDAAGTVTAVATGSAEIVATIDGKSGQATLTVSPPPVAAVTVTLGSASISAGQTTQAAAVLRDAAGNALSGRVVSWSSSNAAVATVSSTGLVSGVAPGTANIIATSEGRTGQAAVTVIATASITSVVLLGPNGQPLDTSRVAGRVELQFDQTLPPGWRGTRELRIGRRVFRRDSVFGPSASTSVRVVPERTTADLASPVATVSAGQLRYDVLPNGGQALDAALIGSVPPAQPTATNTRINFSTQQNNYLHLFAKPSRTVTIDGVPVNTGGVDLQFGAASFDGRLVERVEVLRAPHAATYGSNTAGVLSIVTKLGAETTRQITLSSSELSGESPASGIGYIAKVTWGQTAYDQLASLYTTAGWAASINGSGLAHPVNSTTGITLPANVQLQFSPYPDISAILPGYAPVTNAFHFDNGVTPPPGSFTLRSANTQVDDPLYVTGTEPGVISNRIRPNYDLRFGVTYNWTDRSGIDASKTTIRYGPLASPKTAWQIWSPTLNLPGTGGAYTYSAEACYEDRAGNVGCSDLVTNALNNVTASGSTGGSNLRAAFAIGTNTGNISFGGTTTPLINNFPTVGSASRTVLVNGAVPGLPSQFGAWQVDYWYDGQRRSLYGAGTNGDIPVYYPTTTASNGASGNANFALNNWTLRAQARYGVDEGIYVGKFVYRHLDGTTLGSPPEVTVVNDRTPPIFTSKPTLSSGATARTNWDAMLPGADKVALGGLAWGWNTTTVDTRFHTGTRYFWDDSQPIGNGLAGPPVTMGSWAIGGIIPGSATWADQTGGFGSSAPVGFSSFISKFWDLAGNASLEDIATLLGHAPDRLSTPPIRFEQFQSVPAVCAGPSSSCGSTPRTGFLDGGITVSTSALYVDEIRTLGLHVPSKRVYYLGSSNATQTSPISGGFRTFYFVPFDAAKYGGPSGLYEAFSLAKKGEDFFMSNFRTFRIDRFSF